MSRRARRNKHRRKRVGNADRQEAIRLLSEHHADGRIDAAELDERTTRALEARIGPDLAPLFEDLPGPGVVTDPRPVRRQPDLYELEVPADDSAPRPWYAQWWWLLAAAGVAGLSIIHWSAIIWVMLLWLVIGYPILARRTPPKPALRRRRGVRVHAALTDWEVGQVEKELRRNRRAHAITMYRRFTGADFDVAEREVAALRRQIRP